MCGHAGVLKQHRVKYQHGVVAPFGRVDGEGGGVGRVAQALVGAAAESHQAVLVARGDVQGV